MYRNIMNKVNTDILNKLFTITMNKLSIGREALLYVGDVLLYARGSKVWIGMTSVATTFVMQSICNKIWPTIIKMNLHFDFSNIDLLDSMEMLFQSENSMRHDIAVKGGKFIWKINSMLQELHFVDSNVFMKLVNIYCTKWIEATFGLIL